MNGIKIGPLENISKDFVPDEYKYSKNDTYYFRNIQTNGIQYKALATKEIEILVKNNNTAEDWEKVLVSEDFDPNLVRNCDFWGMVRLGNLTRSYLEFHKLRLPVGLNNCTITSCDIGDNVVLRNVHYLSHYIVGNECILFNIDEMITVDNAKFGNGIVKVGEDEDVRIWLEIGNENGGRQVLPFVGMLPADAYIWSRYRDDEILMEKFKIMTDQLGDTRRGFYGEVGKHTVIKDCRIIKSTNFGTNCYIKGANKLKNLTIQSSEEEPTQIGEGCELVNGIVGYGNNIFYGIKAVRFVTGRNVQLKYSARLLNSYVGANSNISCCEALNNLIFPFHEQHHNNSFLIASTVMGQSNIAAGATIGSNHNSRAADGEIFAKRGFWPGLVTNFKHNSIFASFSLIAKGSYYAEMNIPLPFSLISMGENQSTIIIYPGYWFKYNMYALARNAWKFSRRDKRKVKEQHIETDFLAPDTVEEMFEGIQILHQAIEKEIGEKMTIDEIVKNQNIDKKINVSLDGILSKGKAKILKPAQAIQIYRMMILHYGTRELIKAFLNYPKKKIEDILKAIIADYKKPDRKWQNIGGQIMPESELNNIIKQVKDDKINSWDKLHASYNKSWEKYKTNRRNHGIFSILEMNNLKINQLTTDVLRNLLSIERENAKTLLNWTFDSRQKDYTNEFRKATYRNEKEMNAVLGSISENSFLNDYKKTTEAYITQIETILKKVGK